MKTIPQVDILSSEFKADPFPFFARLRDEAPLWSIVVPDKTRVWLLSRYEDVFALFSDERFLKNRYTNTPKLIRR